MSDTFDFFEPLPRPQEIIKEGKKKKPVKTQYPGDDDPLGYYETFHDGSLAFKDFKGRYFCLECEEELGHCMCELEEETYSARQRLWQQILGI